MLFHLFQEFAIEIQLLGGLTKKRVGIKKLNQVVLRSKAEAN
jgi:hypothetical protein